MSDACSVCAGVPLDSGRPCICGGKGTHDAEVVGLRMGYLDLERQLAVVQRKYDEAMSIMSEWKNIDATAAVAELLQVRKELAEAQAETTTAYRNMKNYQGLMTYANEQNDTLRSCLSEAEEECDALKTALVCLSPTLANDPHPHTVEEQIAIVEAEYHALIQDHADLEAKLAEAEAAHQADRERWMALVDTASANETRTAGECDALKATLARVEASEAEIEQRIAALFPDEFPLYEKAHGGDGVSRCVGDEVPVSLVNFLCRRFREQKATLEQVRAQYEELIFAVGNKYEGESRHQTALRYIRTAERPGGQAVSVGKEAGG